MARPDILRQIRRFCLDCQGNSSPEIQRCQDTQCHLWPLRLGKAESLAKVVTQPSLDSSDQDDTTNTMHIAMAQKKALRVVRAHCLSCAGHRGEVRLCTAKEQCPLWSLRFGVYPATYKRVKARLAQGKRLSLFEG